MDTIFARSTAPGRAGVAVIRLSGPASWEAVARLGGGPLPEPRRLVVRRLQDDSGFLDEAMIVLFEAGRSFTGEVSAELHLHGSVAVQRAVERALTGMDGLRAAEAGEFTRRALENDRMGLPEIEGLGALLEAETEAQRRQATALMQGGLREVADTWRVAVVDVLAALEVAVDFSDEEVPEEVDPGLAATLRRLAAEMTSEADGAVAAQRIASGFEVAIVGAPNAGKSTLLNRLAGYDAALTSDVAGTTRDVVAVRMEIGGFLVSLLDTAGVRQAQDTVERMGVERALARAASADIRLFLDGVPEGAHVMDGDILLAGKCDLERDTPAGALRVSGLTGEGLPDLMSTIAERLEEKVAGAGSAVSARQERALRQASGALAEAADMLDAGESPEICSALVRQGAYALDGLLGRIGTEEVLGTIFASFCIGK